MKLTINYTTDTVSINRSVYLLDDLKYFLLHRYPHLVQRFVIRAIETPPTFQYTRGYHNGELKTISRVIKRGNVYFTYDWKEIFRRAQFAVLPIYQFIQHTHPLTNPPTTAQPIPDQPKAAPLLNNDINATGRLL